MPLASTSESSAPLADFFWIAGVDGQEIEDTYWKLQDEYRTRRETAISDTIEEDAEPDEERRAPVEGRNGQRNSYHRLSKLSTDARLSIRSVESKTSGSNRSSTTIRVTPSPSRALDPNNGEFDFDSALLKFASERESFLSDLSLSAGAITPARPKPRPRTQKLVTEDKPASSNPLRSGIGSVRRHMSFRDMNSMKRQPSVARQGESNEQGSR